MTHKIRQNILGTQSLLKVLRAAQEPGTLLEIASRSEFSETYIRDMSKKYQSYFEYLGQTPKIKGLWRKIFKVRKGAIKEVEKLLYELNADVEQDDDVEENVSENKTPGSTIYRFTRNAKYKENCQFQRSEKRSSKTYISGNILSCNF